MKKIMTFAAVMGTACFQDLSVQSSGPVTIAIGESFKREFKNASHVRWVKIKNVFQARFYNQLEYRLAFFDASGELLMSGRKIPLDMVPPAVRREMEKRIRNSSERNQDPLAVASVYELNNSQGTRYFINLESEGLSMSILALANGQLEIVKKVNNQSRDTMHGVLASHYPGACG